MLLSYTLVLLLCVQCGSRRIFVKHTEQHSLQDGGAADALRAAHKERSEFLTGSHNRISEAKHFKAGERVKKTLLHQEKITNHRQFRFARKAGASSSSGSSASSSSSKSGSSASSSSAKSSSSSSASKAGSSSSSSKASSSSSSSKAGSSSSSKAASSKPAAAAKPAAVKAPAAATPKAPVSSSKAAQDKQSAASKSNVPLQTPFQQTRMNFIPPPPSSEDYPFQAYTLSGGIFDSAFEGFFHFVQLCIIQYCCTLLIVLSNICGARLWIVFLQALTNVLTHIHSDTFYLPSTYVHYAGTCMDLAYRSGNGYCYPPCRLLAPTLNPMDLKNLPPSQVSEPQFMRYSHGSESDHPISVRHTELIYMLIIYVSA